MQGQWSMKEAGRGWASGAVQEAERGWNQWDMQEAGRGWASGAVQEAERGWNQWGSTGSRKRLGQWGSAGSRKRLGQWGSTGSRKSLRVSEVMQKPQRYTQNCEAYRVCGG